MAWLLVVILVIVLLVLFSSGDGGSVRQPYSWRERSVEGDESSIHYRDQSGVVHCERESCSGCAQLRAEKLQRQGYVIEEVEIGRRNSGDL